MPNLVTIEGIDKALEDITYKPGTQKARLLELVREYFNDQDSLNTISAIDPVELISKLWQTKDPAVIKTKRKSLSSLKSAINKDLKALTDSGKNQEGVVLNRDNIFTVSDEKKNSLLNELGITPGSLNPIRDLFTSLREMVSEFTGDNDVSDFEELLSELEETKKTIRKLGNLPDDSDEGDFKNGSDENGTSPGTGHDDSGDMGQGAEQTGENGLSVSSGEATESEEQAEGYGDTIESTSPIEDDFPDDEEADFEDIEEAIIDEEVEDEDVDKLVGDEGTEGVSKPSGDRAYPGDAIGLSEAEAGSGGKGDHDSDQLTASHSRTGDETGSSDDTSGLSGHENNAQQFTGFGDGDGITEFEIPTEDDPDLNNVASDDTSDIPPEEEVLENGLEDIEEAIIDEEVEDEDVDKLVGDEGTEGVSKEPSGDRAYPGDAIGLSEAEAGSGGKGDYGSDQLTASHSRTGDETGSSDDTSGLAGHENNAQQFTGFGDGDGNSEFEVLTEDDVEFIDEEYDDDLIEEELEDDESIDEVIEDEGELDDVVLDDTSDILPEEKVLDDELEDIEEEIIDEEVEDEAVDKLVGDEGIEGVSKEPSGEEAYLGDNGPSEAEPGSGGKGDYGSDRLAASHSSTGDETGSSDDASGLAGNENNAQQFTGFGDGDGDTEFEILTEDDVEFIDEEYEDDLIEEELEDDECIDEVIEDDGDLDNVVSDDTSDIQPEEEVLEDELEEIIPEDVPKIFDEDEIEVVEDADESDVEMLDDLEPSDDEEPEIIDEDEVEFVDDEFVNENKTKPIPKRRLLEVLSDYMEPEQALQDTDILSEEQEEYISQILKRFTPAFVKIPDGRYLTGCTSPTPSEHSLREVKLKSFHIGQLPVTNDLFELFVRDTGYQTEAEKSGFGVVYEGQFSSGKDMVSGLQTMTIRKGSVANRIDGACWRYPYGPRKGPISDKHSHPVVQVSHKDALAFAAWAGKRLPTEEEWEAAARGVGTNPYPWGRDWHDTLGNFGSSKLGGTSPVDAGGREGASPFGICDLMGNVYEWTSSLHKSVRNGGRPVFILKGGCWTTMKPVSIAHRLVETNIWSNIIGFRCAV